MTPWQLDAAADFESARLYYANWDAQLIEVGEFGDASGLSDDDMVARLVLGSQGWPGLGAKLIHVASKLAIAERAPTLHRDHFYRVFERFRLFMRRAGKNPFVEGPLPKAREIWLDDETFSALLDRLEDESRAKSRDAKRAAANGGAR